MRTLERNTQAFWTVTTTYEDEKDSDGNFTGEKIPTYSAPEVVYLSVNPATGEIVQRTFGVDALCDLVGVSTDVILTEQTLLFETEPTSDYETTYDYSVSAISKSLNSYSYGLKSRV